MPIAAVPRYLGTDFREASPGLRFGMLLPIWTTRQDQETEVRKRAQARSREGQEVAAQLDSEGMDAVIATLRQRQRNRLPGLWDKNDFAARSAWNDIKALSQSDKDRMKAIAERQAELAKNLPKESLFLNDATAVAPFTTGLGNEHPLENGFSFLNPYGLPYLPGSGVKGVLRQAARELAGGEWGDSHGWDEEKRYALPASFEEEPIRLSMFDILFGRESGGGETDHFRGTLVFWDVIPQIKGNSLMVEIMTPHQGHYYQEKAFMGSASPHESGQPNPISFLTVPPGSGFVFHVQCDLARLSRLVPDLAAADRWKTLLDAAFNHAFDWLGFGAKTAVGYGQMKRKNGNAQTVHDVLSADKTSDSVAGSAASCLPDKLVWENAVLTWNPGSQTLSAICDAKRKAEAKLGMDRSMVSEEFITRMKKKKTIRANVTVVQMGNAFRIVEVDLPMEKPSA